MTHRGWLLLGLVFSGAAAAADAGVTPSAPSGEGWTAVRPLAVRNLSPLTFQFGLPRALGAGRPRQGHRMSLTVEHSNNFTARARGDSSVTFDGSTTVATVAVAGAVGERWEWGLAVPWVRHGGGFTDGFIEGYHDLLGLPGGNRESAPRDRLRYQVVDRGVEEVSLLDATDHVGDLRARLGYRLHHGVQRSVMARFLVELPTGRAEDLSGSGGTDASAWLELVDRGVLESLGVTVTLMGGVTVPGDGDLLSGRQRDVVLSGHLGLHHPLCRRWTLHAQLDGHTDVLDTPVPVADGALLGTLGGSFAVSNSMRVDAGVVEDLTPGRSPDVVFLLDLHVNLP